MEVLDVGAMQPLCTVVVYTGRSIAWHSVACSRTRSASSASPATALGRVDVVRVADAEVSCEGVVATEGLLLRA